MKPSFSQLQIEQFNDQGFIIARGLVSPQRVQGLRELAIEHARVGQEPIEYEVDVQYPGSPAGRSAPGGDTPRRLLQAYGRDPMLSQWAHDPALLSRVGQLLGESQLRLTQSHHNCVMTKCPAFSSDTGWHQDVRYWAFSNRQLLNTWLALGPEFVANGGLRVIPGSHKWRGLEGSDRLDGDLFLNSDSALNHDAINAAVQIDLEPGDVLLFHAALFHCASRNYTEQVKYSIVFTYHGVDCVALPDTKSSKVAEIELSV